MSAQTDFLNAQTVLRRSRRGDVYHRAECPRIANHHTLPWSWAEGKTRSEVAATALNGLRPCKTCDPLAALPEQGA